MTPSSPAGEFRVSGQEVEEELWRLYRAFFDKAEKKRRWNVAEDIPWDQCNPTLNPAIADVVETFCAVELYLPDYTSKILPVVRPSKGRTWFYANWGYEESKHSLSLHDWLLRSGHRTPEQMKALEGKVFAHEWNLPQDNHLGMLAYAMVQEHATFLNYRNLQHRTKHLGGDPALETLMNYLAIDEKAHFSFFRDAFKVFLKHDRAAAIEQLKRALSGFQMPAIHDLLDENEKRIAGIRDLELFSEEIFFRDVYEYVLDDLGLTKADLKAAGRKPKPAPPAG